MPQPRIQRTLALTCLTLVAFAGNSILCRMALQDGSVDPLSFTALRLASGAQVTMIGVGLAQGERPSPLRALGIACAVAGVVWLVLPGLAAPDPVGALLMSLAGVAWGAYSLFGRTAAVPTAATARNFLVAAPFGLLALLFHTSGLSLTSSGALLALASGVVTSGLGYVLWYMSLPGHSATSAAVVQLAVPVLAAVGGWALLGEEPSARLVGAGALTLGGVALAVCAGSRRR